MKNINMSFWGSQVLYNINFDLNSGEVRGLIGPNGSGKSTIIKILSGAFTQVSGEIYLEGTLLDNSSPTSVLNRGIVTLYQELYLLPDMTITDNIFIGTYRKKMKIFADAKAMKQKTHEILRLFGCNLSPDTKVRNLSQSEKYIVAVSRAFLNEAKILVLDEPTTSLSAPERGVVLNLIRQIKSQGTSVIFITHRLEEIREVCDSLTFMRDGQIAATDSLAVITDEYMLKMMEVGDVNYITNSYPAAEKILEARKLCKGSIYQDINFTLCRGEILGILGVKGSGRSTLLKTIFGAIKPDSGDIYLYRKKVDRYSIQNAIMNGIGYLPDDRLNAGILPNMTILENVILPDRKKNKSLLINKKKETEIFIDCIVNNGWFLSDPNKPIIYLSSGNQQKAIFFRWIVFSSRILLLDEPTQGVDIAAKNEMYNLIFERANEGTSFIICSSDIEELRPVCTRILTLDNGRLHDNLELSKK